MTLFGKRVFANVIKYLRIGSFSIIWAGPKSNDECPHKRESEGDHTDTEEKAM